MLGRKPLEINVDEIVELRETHGLSYEEIGDIFNCARETVRRKYLESKGEEARNLIQKRSSNKENKTKYDESSSDAVPNEKFQKEFDFEKGTGCLISISAELRTQEDVLRYAEVDENLWKVTNCQYKAYQVARKNKEIDLQWNNGVSNGFVSDSGDFTVQTLWSIKLTLSRRQDGEGLSSVEKIIEEYKDTEPNTVAKKQYFPDSPLENASMLVLSLVDQHIGKQAIVDEDVLQQGELYCNAAYNLLTKASSYNIEKIILPIGSDFFHIDNKFKTTTKGTQQDVDSFWTQIYDKGCEAIVNVVDYLRKIAPTELIWIPGNHDFTFSYTLAKSLEFIFRHDSDVIVDVEKLPRKYRIYGATCLGYTHGNEEKEDRLANLIIQESCKLSGFKDVKYFEVHKGHIHKRKKVDKNVSTDTIGKVEIITLPSLSSTDYWHFTKGFTGARRAAEAYIYSREFGKAGCFICDVNEI